MHFCSTTSNDTPIHNSDNLLHKVATPGFPIRQKIKRNILSTRRANIHSVLMWMLEVV
jgi:hypothetical protein